MRTIEFACSHNHGRSPLAEAFAMKYIGLNRRITGYNFISSGTHVDEINEQLAGRKPFTDSERDWINTKNAERFGDNIDPVRAMNRFVNEEHNYRESFFEQFFLGVPKQTHDQMIVRSDVDLVLVMGRKNLDKAREIYGNKARIETLAGFAMGEPGLEFQSAFGNTISDYYSMAGLIACYVKQAIERFAKK